MRKQRFPYFSAIEDSLNFMIFLPKKNRSKTRGEQFSRLDLTGLAGSSYEPEEFWSRIGRFSSNAGRITDCAKLTISMALRSNYDSAGTS